MYNQSCDERGNTFENIMNLVDMELVKLLKEKINKYLCSERRVFQMKQNQLPK